MLILRRGHPKSSGNAGNTGNMNNKYMIYSSYYLGIPVPSLFPLEKLVGTKSNHTRYLIERAI